MNALMVYQGAGVFYGCDACSCRTIAGIRQGWREMLIKIIILMLQKNLKKIPVKIFHGIFFFAEFCTRIFPEIQKSGNLVLLRPKPAGAG